MLNFQIKDVFDTVLANISEFNLTVESVLLMSDASVKKMFNLYGERRMTVCNYNGVPVSRDSFYDIFKYTWDLFVNTNRPNWEKKIKAYGLEYNPLENYNMTEEEKTHRDGDNIVTTEGTFSTNSNSFNNKPSEVRNYVTSDENQNGRLDTYSTSDSDVQTNGGGSNDSTTKQTLADIRRDLTRKGNIGVTTSQQMLKSELELRTMNLTNEIIRQFIEENTFYSEDVEVDDSYYFCYW